MSATEAVRQLVQAFMAMPPNLRQGELARLSAPDLTAIAYHWPLWARPDQLPPEGYWRTWLMLAGRGAGKTRAAAEYINAEVRSGRHMAIALVSPTNETARRDQVAAIVACSPPDFQAVYEPAQRRVVWPNGAIAYIVTAEEPDRARGLNVSLVWGDELTSWSFADDTWSNIQLALRITGPKGDAPRGVVTTTPKRHALLRAILADPATVVTRARTADNAANLDPSALQALERRYAGTSLGRQELDGVLLEEAEGALWTRDTLEACRVAYDPGRPMRRVVVAVDPAGGTGKASTETGIVVCGIGYDGLGYVLGDVSGKFSPERWAHAAAAAFHDHQADRIVAERNFGGEMVAATLRSVAQNLPVRMVNASRGKAVRAEPVSALFEQRKVFLAGSFIELEDQLTGWDPASNAPSPDRLDALVWAITDLMLGEAAPRPARALHIPFMVR